MNQRPALTPELRQRLHDMLDHAITHGYVTGSVGATEAECGPASEFGYSVSYQIRRKLPGTLGIDPKDFEPLMTSPPSAGTWP